MTDPLQPGQVIGILGGGQLGRMLAMAAARLGFQTVIYAPDAHPPAKQVATITMTADYDDEDALRAFAEKADVVTYEFENVPASALDVIEGLTTIRPGRNALAISQDRLDEKTYLQEIGLNTAAFAPVDTPATLAQALAITGQPAILKTRRFGYDGKGQARITGPSDSQAAFDEMHGAPAIAEAVVHFTREISVIGARGRDGRIACFEPGENRHEDGILRTTRVPAAISEETRERAFGIAGTILAALDYVGVIGVELFETDDGLLVNEIAPRVHNSGHWTEAGAVIDQFEQHIRAVAGWRLVDPIRHSDVEMENLIGDEVDGAIERAGHDGVRLHLYGKAEARAGRKMGHITRILGPARDRT